ncbi:hypothetical protein ASL11_27480 [Paenibacillus sp. Soil750]|nr:hypothetical protein ASL11_27480 [Paenibacillus sp. Soil750]
MHVVVSFGFVFGSDAGQHQGPINIIPRSLFISQTSYFLIIGMLPVSGAVKFILLAIGEFLV